MSNKTDQNVWNMKWKPTTRYIPPIPCDVNVLQQINELENFTCSHVLFASSGEFVDYVLWMICPQKEGRTKVTTKKMIHEFYLSLLDGMCIHCINTLLTKKKLKDIIALNKIYFDIQKTPYMTVNNVVYNLKLRSLDVLVNSTIHPKIPMLIVKSLIFDKTAYTKETNFMRQVYKTNEFPISKSHDFNWLWNITMGIMGYFNPIPSSQDRPTSVCSRFTGIWLRAFFLSVKYWNDYQMLFFIEHYRIIVQQQVADLGKKSFYSRSTIPHDDSINKLFRFLCIEIGIRCAKFKLTAQHWPLFLHNKHMMKNRIKEMKTKQIRKWVKSLYVENVKCCWTECNNNHCVISKQVLKVCSKCKMAYYCSKSCQKKAWNTNHRYHCKTLNEWYQ
eukprot:545115_1